MGLAFEQTCFTFDQRMQLFFATDLKDDLIFLGPDEARHATQVLRHAVGDTLTVVDGQGTWYETTILESGKKRCILRVDEKKSTGPRAPFSLHLAVAPPKNISRFEWFLEKATEIGVDEITPLLCFHSERKNVRPERLERILLAAMKQSLKAWLPRLNPMVRLEEFLRKDMPLDGQAFIAHLGDQTRGSLKDNYLPGKDVTILIGPEGDFSPEEIDRASAVGFQAVSLGDSRLRTETAALVACHTVNLMQS